MRPEGVETVTELVYVRYNGCVYAIVTSSGIWQGFA